MASGKEDFGSLLEMLVPGLAIETEGVGNDKGQLEAKKIEFDPDIFAIEVAEEKQIQANQTEAGQAQATAMQAQRSANQARATVLHAAGQTAVLAGAVAVQNKEAVRLVNQRVSGLADYKTVGEAGVFFKTSVTSLSDDDKAALTKLARGAASIQNYMIEIAGYASSTETKAENLKLSDERAAAVANYLPFPGRCP